MMTLHLTTLKCRLLALQSDTLQSIVAQTGPSPRRQSSLLPPCPRTCLDPLLTLLRASAEAENCQLDVAESVLIIFVDRDGAGPV